jgi:hypothetical protein
MRADFEQATYNIHEHDYIDWTDEQLQNRLSLLIENSHRIKYTGERLHQVNAQIGNMAFELSERFRSTKNEEIEMAWSEHE